MDDRYSNLMSIKQISESHCGPAVVQMLLRHNGLEITQMEITKAAGANETIAEFGTNVKQLAKAVKELAPELIFWCKDHADIIDLEQVVVAQQIPVAVEWQGIFDDETKEDEKLGMYGHYSLITDITEEMVEMIDPYDTLQGRNRSVDIDTFLHRWWDWNVKPETIKTKPEYEKDINLFFTVTARDIEFPSQIGMKKLH